MEKFFAVQQKFKQDNNLRKIPAVINKNYKAHGTKSYVYLLNRFGFNPTKPGPYYHERQAHQTGMPQAHLRVGGVATITRSLRKKTHHSGSGSGTGTGSGGGKGTGAGTGAGTGGTGTGGTGTGGTGTGGTGTGSTGGGQSGEVTAEDQQNDSMYLCEVQIGTPPQTVRLDFDTGSADLWVFSTELSSSVQHGHNVFNPSKSTSWKPLSGLSWKISYGDGSSASGDCGSDVVSIGGLNVENQCVELAKTLSSAFAQGTGDGLLGLAFPEINTVMKGSSSDPQPTPVVNMITQKDIPQDAELFTCALYSERDGNEKSFYTFGYIDQDLVTASGSEIIWTPIDSSQGFWMFPSTTATINGKQMTISGNKAIADTGTTLALLSDQVVDALYAAIPGAKYDSTQQGYLFPLANKASDMPKFSVAVGDHEFVIQPEDLAFAPVDSTYWYGGIQSRGDNPFDILGDAFLKSIYAIWDQGNKRFGAVPKIEKTQNMVPTQPAQ